MDRFAERAKELAAELMRDALDDMQERAQEGRLVMLDDDGNVIAIPSMQEETDMEDMPADAQGKLDAQMHRIDVWAQQVADNAL